MEVKGKVKTIYPPEKLSFQDGRTYTQQLILLDCGEYSRGGDFYENDLPFYFGEKHLGKLSSVAIGAQVSVSFGIKGRTYTYTDKKRPSDRAHRIQRAPQRLRHSGGGPRAASARSSNRTRVPTTTTSPDASPHGSNASTTSRASASISTDASSTSAADGRR